MLIKSITPFNKFYWQSAVKEIYNPIKLVFAANIIAIRVVLQIFSVPVFLTNNLYISFEFLFNALGAAVCGPILAIFASAIADILSYIIFPKGPFYFPFTVLAMFSSLIFSLFLYKTKITVLKIAMSKFLINILINVFGNYFVLYFLYGAAAKFDFWIRLGKNLLILPLEVFCLSIFLNAVLPVAKKFKLV